MRHCQAVLQSELRLTFSAAVYERSDLSTLLSALLGYGIFVGARRELMVALLRISLPTEDAKHLFTCLSVICVSL